MAWLFSIRPRGCSGASVTALLAAVLLFLAGPANAEDGQAKKTPLTLTKKDNGREIAVSVGDVFVVELERSGATGYEWHADPSFTSNLRLLKERKRDNGKKGIVGAPVVRTWRFKAVKGGQQELTIRLYRDWEGREKSADTFQVKVRIE